jgi:hypothetical protein
MSAGRFAVYFIAKCEIYSVARAPAHVHTHTALSDSLCLSARKQNQPRRSGARAKFNEYAHFKGALRMRTSVRLFSHSGRILW